MKSPSRRLQTCRLTACSCFSLLFVQESGVLTFSHASFRSYKSYSLVSVSFFYNVYFMGMHFMYCRPGRLFRLMWLCEALRSTVADADFTAVWTHSRLEILAQLSTNLLSKPCLILLAPVWLGLCKCKDCPRLKCVSDPDYIQYEFSSRWKLKTTSWIYIHMEVALTLIESFSTSVI